MRIFLSLGISVVLALAVSGCTPVHDSAATSSTAAKTEYASTEASESPSESELDALIAEDLAESLVFSFDNFQCWSGDDCKVIYNLDYYGSAGLHQILDFGWNTTGQIVGPNGELAQVGTIVVQDSDGIAFGSFDLGVTYKVIINTNSELGASYQSIYLENKGFTLLEENFGCFVSKAETVETSPTC